MTTTRPWLGISPAECLKDSDTPQSRPSPSCRARIATPLPLTEMAIGVLLRAGPSRTPPPRINFRLDGGARATFAISLEAGALGRQ